MKTPTMLLSDADFSADSVHRYSLTRIWNFQAPLAFLIGLNPSTADHWANDPTITREIGFAKSWGCGGLLKGNLFGYRATKPIDMMRARDPVGRDNDDWLLHMARRAYVIVACWGTRGMFKNRDAEVIKLIRDKGKSLKCFGFTKDGAPKHPLYLKADTRLVDWKVSA